MGALGENVTRFHVLMSVLTLKRLILLAFYTVRPISLISRSPAILPRGRNLHAVTEKFIKRCASGVNEISCTNTNIRHDIFRDRPKNNMLEVAEEIGNTNGHYHILVFMEINLEHNLNSH